MNYKEYQELKRFEKEVEVKTLESVIEYLNELEEELKRTTKGGESIEPLSLLIDIEGSIQSRLRNVIAERDRAYNIK